MNEGSVLFSYQTEAHRDSLKFLPERNGNDAGYARVARCFTHLFRASNIASVELLRPEIFSKSSNYKALFGDEMPVHFIFKRPNDIRVVKGAYNIGVLIWDDIEVQSAVVDRRPFSNTRRMLGLLDEIWVPSLFVQRQFVAAGLSNVHVIPCPFEQVAEEGCLAMSFDGLAVRRWRPGASPAKPEPLAAFLPDNDEERGNVFVAVFDRDDWRAGAAAVVGGFVEVLRRNPGINLIVAGRDGFDPSPLTARFNQPRLAGDFREGTAAISIVQSPMTARQLATLFRRTAFYVCASRLEGQNLPMIEAMAAGCIPVTVRHSAMVEYLDESNSVSIPTISKRVTFAEGGRERTFLAPEATEASCVAALQEAFSLDAPARKRLSAHAKRAVETKFNSAAVRPLALARLKAVAI